MKILEKGVETRESSEPVAEDHGGGSGESGEA